MATGQTYIRTGHSQSIVPTPHKPPAIQVIEEWLVCRLAERLGIPAGDLDIHQPLVHYGLDSLAALELVAALEEWLARSLPHTLAWDCPTIAAISQYITACDVYVVPLASGGENDADSPLQQACWLRVCDAVQQATASIFPLSYSQQALWFLHQQAPESAAHTMAHAARLRIPVAIPAMCQALQQLVDRHAALRTTFTTQAGQPVQQVHAHMEVYFRQEAASTWSLAFLQYRLTEDARRPFDLEHGPLLRLHLYTRSAYEHVLLLVVHHIVADFWSLAVLLHEFGVLYQSAVSGTTASLSPLRQQYTDYVRWQANMLASPVGTRLWTYWQQQLAGALPMLNLPTDRPRSSVQPSSGASQSLRLSPALTQQLKGLSRAQGTTLYTSLLAAFYVLLYRYTGQEDLLVGSPVAGRNRAELARLVGHVVNPVALRVHLAGNPTFTALLRLVRQTVLAAFAHQDYPFALLVERLQVRHDTDRSPFGQVMFMLQQPHQRTSQDLTPFALGEKGGQLEVGGLCLESIALEQQAATCDLTLTIAEVEGVLAASLQYNTTLFDQPTMRRMLGHFQTLLEGIVTDPQQRIASLPMCTAAEQYQLLVS